MMHPKLLHCTIALAVLGTAAVASAQAPHAAAHPSIPVCDSIAPGWSVPESERTRAANAGELLNAMAAKDVVLLGEYHDQDDDHRWQVQALAALHLVRPNMVIGFEMLPRRVQGALDRWIAGELTVKQFLEQSEWGTVWSAPAELYLPLFQFARINRIPMVALNVDQKLSKMVAEKGWDAIPEAEREGVGRPAAPAKEYLDTLAESYREHPGKQAKESVEKIKASPEFRRFVESQTIWDRAMAEALARRLSARPKPLVVGIMGSGHIRSGYGVPHQLGDLGVKNVGKLIPLHAESDCKDIRAGMADVVFGLPKQVLVLPDPPRLGVSLDESDGKVRVAQITAGSLAEKTGLKVGDQFIEIAGTPAKKMGEVIAAVRQQPAGTWLPMKVRRGSDVLDLVVKFPAAQ